MNTDIAVATAEQARSLTDRIKVAVDGTWFLIQEAYVSRAWSALGYLTWDDYCTREFGTSRLRLPREERQEVVASLREIGMSTRAIAAATGTNRETIRQEIEGGKKLSPAAAPTLHDLDDVLRENGIDPDEIENDDKDGLTRPLNGDHGPVPAPPGPRPVLGTDGKTYTQPGRVAAPQRPALPPQFQSATRELSRAIARIERLQGDDRYRANRGSIADCLPEIRRAAQVLQALFSDLDGA